MANRKSTFSDRHELLELSDLVFRLEPMIQEVALGLVIPDEHGDYSDNEMSSNYGPYMEKLAHCANLKKVTSLEGHETKLGPSGMELLAQLPNLTAAKRLYLFEDVIGESGVKAIVESPSLLRLEKLELNGCLVDWPDDTKEDPRTVPAVRAIAKAPTMAHLKILDLSFNSIGDKGAALLVESPYLSDSLELGMMGNPITRRMQEVLTRRFGRLVVL